MTDERHSDDPIRGEDPSAAIDRLVADLDGIQRRDSGRTVEYVRGGLVFAVRDGIRLGFRLRPEIVAAALGTPETSQSDRGAEWIALESTAVDEFTLDRARAWFETAWRLAGEAAEPRPRVH
jgi:hypothetical protein